MSYDFSLMPYAESHDCDELRYKDQYCWRCAAQVDLNNITSNVSPMFAMALSATGIPNTGITWLNGKRGQEAGPYLARMAAHMEAHPEVYRPMNPPNRWGSYEGALETVQRLASACRALPTYTLRISW